jgi:formate dehydrogenase iron-sulfur subunit
MSKAILYDATLCIGCLECESGCARANNLPYEDAEAELRATSDRKFTYVAHREEDDTYMRRLCMHCEDPACASVCPVGALRKTADGPVVYEEWKCMGCRYCMVACPFGIPKYEWTKKAPGVRKCTMCSERLAAGGITACSEACPTESTITGDRDALLAEARRRIEQNPDKYVNQILGYREVGGTSVLMISSVPFTEFGYNASYVTEPLPDKTWAALSRVPDVVTFGFVLLGGIWWITSRRDEVAAAEAQERSTVERDRE